LALIFNIKDGSVLYQLASGAGKEASGAIFTEIERALR
jgi:hypothetical protein